MNLRAKRFIAALLFIACSDTDPMAHSQEPSAWADPLDPVAISLAEVISGQRPVLWVVHEAGHGGWQFYDGFAIDHREPVVIPKVELLNLDPSLEAITDLPAGWQAERTSRDSDWVRSPFKR